MDFGIDRMLALLFSRWKLDGWSDEVKEKEEDFTRKLFCRGNEL